MVLYFAYGSNMFPEELKRWCPNSIVIGVAQLKGYRLAFTRFSTKRNGGVADIVKDTSSVVWGVLYEVPEEEVSALDQKEGYPGAYTKTIVTIETLDGHVEEAMTYVVVNKNGPYAPSKSYWNLLIKGASYHKLPQDYIDSLRLVPVI